LYAYPVLMAADILLYQTNLVPVGADQKQHLELTRDLAERFNNAYSETFAIPEPYIAPIGARIMSLQDPTAKMSKSDENERNYISLLDPLDVAANKIKRAVTDSGTTIEYDESRPGISNLMTIYSSLTNETFDAIRDRYVGKGYAEFKTDLAEIVVEFMRGLQGRYNEIIHDKPYLEGLLNQGAEHARRRATRTLRKVYKKIGFIQTA
jgi:tryptophanyl-tRNA synthetase